MATNAVKYGARYLKRAIERHIGYRLANLLATDQVCLGDGISIDCDIHKTALKFARETQGAPPRSAPQAFQITAMSTTRPDSGYEKLFCRNGEHSLVIHGPGFRQDTEHYLLRTNRCPA